MRIPNVILEGRVLGQRIASRAVRVQVPHDAIGYRLGHLFLSFRCFDKSGIGAIAEYDHLDGDNWHGRENGSGQCTLLCADKGLRVALDSVAVKSAVES